jgi:class 3 adenylate cyclase
MKQPVERRLAAILAADVAGYSRLMGADEEGTLERLKAHRRELVNPKIKEHRGRIVKTTGDGMLLEFPSVVVAARYYRGNRRRCDQPRDRGLVGVASRNYASRCWCRWGDRAPTEGAR